MVICGIKLTHDGAIALIDEDRLVFSYETEKFGNNKRHSDLVFDLSAIEALLDQHDYSLKRIDRLVVDGWGDPWNPPEIEENEFSLLVRFNGDDRVKIKVSRYGHLLTSEDVLDANDFRFEPGNLEYRSYMHVSGHIFSAYCSSPFARANASSFVLVWDGIMPPQLFHYDPRRGRTRNCGALFPVLGSIYTLFPYQYEPFNRGALDHSIAGKAMAYVALGKPVPEVLREFKGILDRVTEESRDLTPSPMLAAVITKALVSRVKSYGLKSAISSPDMIASFHYFIQGLLVTSLTERVKSLDLREENLCFAGGCALNIKWNSALRDAGIFKHMWVPPFSNDSGSAIGAACCELVNECKTVRLDWNVYSGQPMRNLRCLRPGWSMAPCTLEDLAKLIHRTGQPIVFLNGRAELGPRALGNRSILAPAGLKETKQLLNEIKIREDYRPVAPVCLEEDAPAIFTPGSPDPYMLFEHEVRESWRDKIPAVCHLDGTARLQTITKQQNPVLHELLTRYKQLSGISLLCNTSANQNGKGFFPDIESAMDWGQINYIWNDGCLYSKRIGA